MSKLGYTWYPQDWWTSETYKRLKRFPLVRYAIRELLDLMYKERKPVQMNRDYLIDDFNIELSDDQYKKLLEYITVTEDGKWWINSIKKRISKSESARENGKKGGAPIGNFNAKKTTQKQPKNNLKTTQKQPKNNPKTTQQNNPTKQPNKPDKPDKPNKQAKKQPKNNLKTTQKQPNKTTQQNNPNNPPLEREIEIEIEREREIEINNKKTNKKNLLSAIKITDLESTLKFYYETAVFFQKLFIKNLKQKNAPTKIQEQATFENYVTPIRLMFENDGVTREQISRVYKFLDSAEGDFWKSNILSTKKLRENFQKLAAKANTKITKNEKLSNTTTTEYPKINRQTYEQIKSNASGWRVEFPS